MLNEYIIFSGNHPDLIKQWKKDCEQGGMYYYWDVQEEIKGQMIRMVGGNLIESPSQYDKI